MVLKSSTSPRHRKRQHANHVTGKRGVDLVKKRLPDHWVIRELNPDYGLDIHVEVFDLLPDGSGSSDTLGEHFYAQVKGVTSVKKLTKEVRYRTNVAKGDLNPDEGEQVDIEVVTLSLETNELLTVESMGAAVPALLFVADLTAGTVYFVCLNDYISKVLLVEKPNYADQDTHTIYVPAWNTLDPTDDEFAYMWLLARRGKLYAAFNTFVYQRVEMDNVFASCGSSLLIAAETHHAQLAPDIVSMLRVFVRANLRLDIWEPAGPGFWSPLNDVYEGFKSLQGQLKQFSQAQPVDAVWRYVARIDAVLAQAANLGRMYEEVVREWRLPTALAVQMDRSTHSG